MILRVERPFSAKHFRIMKYAAVLFITFISFNSFGQAKEKSDAPKKRKGFQLDPDRLVFGGNLGASFGDITVAEISPTVGYLATDNWLVGVGATYIYYEDRLFGLKTSIYGGKVFTQYYLFEYIITHLEFELLNTFKIYNINERVNVASLLIGGGYRSEIGGNSFLSLMILYNLTESIHYPYSNPIIRGGIGIGM